ncbi:MAG: nucleotidyltransferase family protein [Phycisphaerae bacterium]|nr:nucleotidyltransferase family protein [Phycisphaerae bacterium]
MINFDLQIRTGGLAAIREASRFLMRDDPVHRTLAAIAKRFDELNIEYAVVGGMALVAHGYLRTTADVDLLVRPDGLEALHRALDGRGYLPPFEGSRNLRDTSTGVRIEFVVTGQYPGDGKPKPVAFPEPSAAFIERDGIRFITLEKLIELKLASGISNPGRLRDLADVQELIRELQLPADFADRLDPFVRAEFARLRSGLA